MPHGADRPIHGAPDAVPDAAPDAHTPARRVTLARVLSHQRLFRFWERLGVHVTPVHFYQPIPDTRTLTDEHFLRRSEMPGVRMDTDAMSRLLADLAASFGSEFASLATRPQAPGRFHIINGKFESVDAEILWGMIRARKPRRIIEVGSGHSTLLALEAIERNKADDPAHSCSMTTIDPYPPPFIAPLIGARLSQIARPVQDVPASHFESLGENDILFIDSTHVLAIGSDVQHEFLEVIPRVPPGVLVHVHDIFLPAEYPRSWVLGAHRFWTEQYLLQAFLAFNDSFETIWAGHLMHLRRADDLRARIPSYDPARVEPGSIWLRRTR